jgi:hypothetical protein
MEVGISLPETFMNWCDTIRDFRSSTDWTQNQDWIETERLKDDIRQFRREHPRAGLSAELFHRVLDWKLRRQRARTERRRLNLTPHCIALVVECAFSLGDSRSDALDDLRLRVLSSMPGVGSGVASAILALSFPESYGVIDFRVWEVIFDEKKKAFGPADYVRYLQELRNCSAKLGVEPQFIDFLAWTYWDARKGQADQALHSSAPRECQDDSR